MKRKLLFLIALIALLFCILTIQETYAKYVNSVGGAADMNIARWRILVNNQDIRDNASINQIITPTLITNEHIKEGVIAPTSEGYFDLIIDSTNADVSFSYSITMSSDENSPVSDLLVTGYSLNDGDVIPVQAGETINNTILYKDGVTTTSLRVYVKWFDGEGEMMDNLKDAVATALGIPARIKVNLSFIQVAE